MRRGVRVRRVVRRFELWSVAKVAFFFHLLCYLLTVGVLAFLWLANSRLGTIDKLEKLFEQYGFGDNFQIHGDVLLRVVASVGGVMVLVATVATIALAFFYNGISLVVGGLVVSVLEERPPARPAAADTTPATAAVMASAAAAPSGLAHDAVGFQPPPATAAAPPVAAMSDAPDDTSDWTLWQRPATWPADTSAAVGSEPQPVAGDRPA